MVANKKHVLHRLCQEKLLAISPYKEDGKQMNNCQGKSILLSKSFVKYVSDRHFSDKYVSDAPGFRCRITFNLRIWQQLPEFLPRHTQIDIFLRKGESWPFF